MRRFSGSEKVSIWVFLGNLISLSFIVMALVTIDKGQLDRGLMLLAFAVLCRILVVVERGDSE